MCFEQKLGCFEDSLNLSKILNFPWKQLEEAKSAHTKISIETKVFEMVNPYFQNLLVICCGSSWPILEVIVGPLVSHHPIISLILIKSGSNISPWVLFYLWKVQVLLKLSKKVLDYTSLHANKKNSKLIFQILHKKR